MLPTSRNKTYATDSVIEPVDLNDLQDCVIGAKHPLVFIPLGASCWQQKSGGGGVEGDNQWTFSALAELVCGLRLLPGTVIQSVQWSYNRGGAGTITRRGRRRNILTAAAASNWLAEVADVDGAAIENPTDTPAFTTVASEGLQLSISFTNAANVFYGAVIGISRL